MMYLKEKFTDAVASNWQSGNFPENFTLHSRHRCYKLLLAR